MLMMKVDRVSEALIGRRFFYGWVIVFISFVASLVSGGIGAYGLSFFVLPMSQELGISRAAFSSITLFRMVPLVVAPVIGMLVDTRHGPRLLLAIGSVLAGTALILTSRVHNLWQFYLSFGIVFGLAVVTMGDALIGASVIAKWFVRMRGRAMAIGTMGISVGGLAIAPLTGWLIGQFGWRAAWIGLGLLLTFSVGPVAAVFMRRRPEDVGLLPDGDSSAEVSPSQGKGRGSSRAREEYPWTVREALATRALWLLLGAQITVGAAISGVWVHQVAYMQDKGFDVATATAVTTALAFFALCAKGIWGFLIERAGVEKVATPCFFLFGIAVFLLIRAHSVPMLYAYAVAHGLGTGFPVIMNVAWATFFGRQNIGSIRGAIAPFASILGAVSPVFTAWLWDVTGSYDLPYTILALILMSGGSLMLLARPPRPPQSIPGAAILVGTPA